MAILVQSNRKPSVSFPSQTGSIVTFNSQYAGLPLKSHKVAVTATQSGSGTPSPVNERPIIGYNAINISHSGADTSTPTVYTINLGGTYYGGEYDARTGLFKATHKIANFADMDIIISATGIFYVILSDSLIPTIDNNIISNMMQWGGTSRTWLNDKTYAIAPWNDASERFAIKGNGTETTIEDLKTSLTGTYIVYELATPTTIQLPPCPIDTFEVNNIWADTGETTAQYIKIG